MDGSGEPSYRPQTAGSKQIKCEHLQSIASPASIAKADGNKSAPTSRVYTKDYSKVSAEKSDKDDVTVYLGNPLRW